MELRINGRHLSAVVHSTDSAYAFIKLSVVNIVLTRLRKR